MRKWQSRRVRAIRRRWWKFTEGVKYALGLGPIWVNTTCPCCERDIEVEAD